ncbi:hypothetical protein GCM10023257_21380 [Streptomyces hyderabadensis]|uniref:Uncharacterized protein n=1 Tax=Streptomyces hyderabadensis TaxID=598549 RepID=A0ABP9HYK1_9ACTN
MFSRITNVPHEDYAPNFNGPTFTQTLIGTESCAGNCCPRRTGERVVTTEFPTYRGWDFAGQVP